MSRRVLVANPNVAVVIGIALFLLGSLFLHDAYEGRGRPTPGLMRPFTWW